MVAQAHLELFNIEFGFNTFRNVCIHSQIREIQNKNQYKTKKKDWFPYTDGSNFKTFILTLHLLLESAK